MSTFTQDAGDILIKEDAKVDLLFDAIPVQQGDAGDPCTVSPASCDGYTHTTHPGPPFIPGSPPTSPSPVAPISDDTRACFDTWEDTLNGEVYILLEELAETSLEWQNDQIEVVFSGCGNYNISNAHTYPGVTASYQTIAQARFYEDGTSDLDGLYARLAKTVMDNMIANKTVSIWGGYNPTTPPHALPQTIDFWNTCSIKPIMKYENESLPRPSHGGSADAAMFTGNAVWIASLNWGNAPDYIAPSSWRPPAGQVTGEGGLIKWSGDPTLDPSDPNQYVEYCPSHVNYPYYPPNGINTGSYASPNISRRVDVFPVFWFADSYNGQGFDKEDFLTYVKGGVLGSVQPLICDAYTRAPCLDCPAGWQWDKPSGTCVEMADASEPCTGNKRWVKLSITNLADPIGSLKIDSGTI